MTTEDPCWEITINGLNDPVKVCVTPDINQMTTYVLLEQEDWFEAEMKFVRSYITPDMNALDIGANHGVYALSIAQRLDTGHVWAFEPTQAPFCRLAQSIERNGFDTRITLETVGLMALDDYVDRTIQPAVISFVKMDAEGEEVNILAGGHRFFTDQSPLVMFKCKHGDQVNQGLMESFEQLGYQIYRYVPGLNVLVAHDKDYSESFLLNLFACKPDRELMLQQRGLLVKAPELSYEESLNLVQTLDWKEEISRQDYARHFYARWVDTENEIPPEYLSALALCLKAYDDSQPVSKRLALLYAAQSFTETLLAHPDMVPHFSLWLLKIHIQELLGNRLSATSLAKQLILYLYGPEQLAWPFLPPTPEDFTRSVAGDPVNWLRACLLELAETKSHYSTFFRDQLGVEFTGLLQNPNHSPLVERMGLLWLKRHQSAFKLSASHALLNPDLSPNAKIWREIMGA